MIEIEVFDEMFDYLHEKYLSDCCFQDHLNHHLFLYHQIYQNDVLKKKDKVELFSKKVYN